MRARSRLFLVLLGLLFTGPAFAAAKLAFVVGIDSYPQLDAGAQLQRAVTDANAVGDTLQGLGYTVSRVTADANLGTLLSRLDAFSRTIQPGDTVVFYYAGHGVAFDDGTYLIPADIPLLGPGDEFRARRLAIPEKDVSQAIQGAGAKVIVMVIDACRDNPFPKRQTRSLGGERGLARLQATSGVFSLYSAREGQTALDRLPGADTDPDSIFTRIFLKELKSPGISLSELGDRVRDEVADLAQTADHDQVPAVYNDLRGARSVFLNDTSPVAVAAAAPVQTTIASTATPVRRLAVLEAPSTGSAAPDPSLQSSTAPPPAANAAQDCDRLAASNNDERRPPGIAGLNPEDIDPRLAIPACQAAHAGNPTSARLDFQLGRSLLKAGDAAGAAAMFGAAADQSYPAAVTSLGFLAEKGEGVPRDPARAAHLFRTAADAGNALGMNNLGHCYEAGVGVEKDFGEAARWYRKAAEAGNLLGMSNFGFMLERGNGVTRDPVEAVRWFQKAADAGSAPGYRHLGYAYEMGNGVPKDPAKAVQLYHQAIDAGDAFSMGSLGSLYAKGLGVAQDDAEAVRWYKKAADLGNASGARRLGYAFEAGAGVPQDYGEAARWYQKAADGGDSIGMNNLGSLFFRGYGVPRDPTQGLAWTLKAAQNGEPIAMKNLGEIYLVGNGVAKDPAVAVQWFRKASLAGNTVAMRHLGYALEEGEGTARNVSEAVSWYQKGADAGDGLSMNNLGTLYGRGVGVTRNPVTAATWYRKAADLGQPVAMANLGYAYAEGSGVPRDPAAAAAWLRKAAQSGAANAKDLLKRADQLDPGHHRS